MRLLVTGGAGFVLSNVVARWLRDEPDEGAASCVIFDLARAWDASAQGFLSKWIASGCLKFFEGDVTSSEVRYHAKDRNARGAAMTSCCLHN